MKMADTPQRLVDRLLEEGEKTRQFFEAVPAVDWDLQVYSDGGQWRIRQILAHFVAAEASIQRLLKNILDGGEGTPLDFDLNHFNESRVSRLEGTPPSELLSEFYLLRQQTAQLVAGINPEDLARTGRHPFLGVASLEEIIKLMYRHNQIHQRDIRKRVRPQ
jgi:DinB superfamily